MFHNPPKIAEKLLRFLLRKQDKEIILGDIEEIYNDVVTDKGLWFGMLWYWFHIIKSLFPVIYKSIYWGVAMFKSYIKITWRNIIKNKVYSLINLFGLALGLAAFILISLFVEYELSYDTYHKNAERIFRVVRENPQRNSNNFTRTAVTPAPLAPVAIEEIPEVISGTRFTKSTNVLVECGEKHFTEEKIFWTDPQTLEIFTLPFMHGDSETALKDPYCVLLSEKMAMKYFGENDPVGKILTLYDRHDFTVTGVFKDMPNNSHFTMDIILPYETYFLLGGNSITHWGGNFSYTYLLVKESAIVSEIENKFKSIYDKYVFAGWDIPDKYKTRAYLQSLTDIHLYSHLNQELEPNSDITFVFLFFATAMLFLVIGCINYMNLATARSGKRSKEVGLRKVVGANRLQLIKQFLGESFVLSTISMVIAIALVLIVLPAFNNIINRPLNFNLFDNPFLLISIVLITIMVGLFAGSYPAFRMSNFLPVIILRGSFLRDTKGLTLRNLLVVAQFSITIVILVVMFVIADQVDYIMKKDMGYNRDQIILVKVENKKVRENIETIKSQLIEHSDIISVATCESLPNNIDYRMKTRTPDIEPEKQFTIYYNVAGYDFTDLFDIEIIEGRNFNRNFGADAEGAVLVNEAAVKAAEWENPIGKDFVHWSNDTVKVVGVMKDFHLHSLHRPIEPLYVYLNPEFFNYIALKINPSDVQMTLDNVEAVIQKFLPDYPLNFSFFDETFEKMYSDEKRTTTIFSAFSLLAVIVACLGLFGLSAFTAEQKTKEIGIRKVLGASVPSLIFLLSKEFAKWVLLANLLAWPLAYFSVQAWLDNFVYSAEISFAVFVLSGALALIVALVTVSRQAFVSSNANPVESLKNE